MFEPQETTPWHQSTIVLLVSSLVAPPVGLVLLWFRRRTPALTKLLGTLCLILLATGYFFGFRSWRNSIGHEAVYSAVEKSRAEQKAQTPAADPSTTGVTAPPAGSPGLQSAANGQSAPAGSAAETASAHASRNYWTSFRGPNRDGKYDEMAVMASWPAQGLTPVWKQPIGIGYGSFTVADGRAYTLEQRRKQEVAAAYDPATGRELWTQGWNAEFTDPNGDGPRSTPTWDEGRLYALGATGELRCLDARTGAVLWGKNILTDNQATNLPWAMAGSPLIVDDKLIVLPGGSGNKSVVAYNKLTGAPVWKSQSDTAAYVSPMLVTLAGRRQILVVSANRVFGLVPEDGSLIWTSAWDTSMGINAAQPIIVDKNHVFISSGYSKGAALIEISGSGKSLSARNVWENINMKNKFNSSVLDQGYIYGLDEGILTCVDANSGERKWKGGRFGYGQVLLAGGNLIISSASGELALVRATPDQYSELARFQALEGQTWNYPAIAGGRLLIRNAAEMAAFNIAAQ